MSNVERRMSNVERRMSNVERRMSNVDLNSRNCMKRLIPSRRYFIPNTVCSLLFEEGVLIPNTGEFSIITDRAVMLYCNS